MGKLLFTYIVPGLEPVSTCEDDDFVIPPGAFLIRTSVDTTVNPDLASGIAKLVDLGLTPDEAQAVASPTT